MSTKFFGIAVCLLLVAGCGQGVIKAGAAAKAANPFEHQLPKQPPDEKYRVVHPVGYSMVYPPGWKTQSQHFTSGYFIDGLNTDNRVDAFGTEDFNKPSMHIIRFSAEGKQAVQMQLAHGIGYFSGTTKIQFQDQPAWSGFDPGRLPARPALKNLANDSRGGYPYLTQKLIIERNGDWFLLTFQIRNIQKNRGPFITQPVPIIEEYFETFEYEPAGKK
jgi:hypothetical protein